METVILVVHLILALCLIAVVLLQRSEGGGLGMGSGGGGVMSARGAATALGKLTWGFAIAFIATSIALTVLAAKQSADSSVLDRLGIDAPAPVEAPASDSPLGGGSLLPPAADPVQDVPTPRAD